MTTGARPIPSALRGRIGLAPMVSVLVGIIVVGSVFELALGTPWVSPERLPGIAFSDEGDRIERIVVRELRAPRLILALLSGAALALAGAVLQSILSNPLASPELLGVSAGASLVMALILILNVPLLFVLHPWAALGGGLVGGGIVLFITRHSRRPVEVALAGAAVSAILSALILGVIGLAASSGAVQLFFLFTVGNLANRSWSHVTLVLPWVVATIPLILVLSRTTNVLQLGDEVATGLGVSVHRTRVALLLLSTALVAAVVAVVGPVAWVGLLAPHLARLAAASADNQIVLPLSALTGAALLVSADLIARLIVYPSELPVGLCTTLIAAPPALILLRQTLFQERG